jgi:hypothetical protein
VGLGALRRWLADLEDEDAELNPRRYDRAQILADSKRMSRAEVRTKHGCSSRFLSDLLSGKLEP